MNTSTKEQANGPDGANGGERSAAIDEIMRSVRSIQQDMDSKLKNMEEKIQRFLDNLDDGHDYESRDGWSEEQQQQQQQHQQNSPNSPKGQQQGTLTQ